jgi:serine/threonine protein kinase
VTWRIKFLHASLCEGEDYRARFLQEARAAGGLSHPNIVVVHDVGEIEGRPYMAMELLGGTSLAEELEKSKTIPVRDVVVMGIQLARALDYAHAAASCTATSSPATSCGWPAAARSRSPTSASRTWTTPAARRRLRTRAGDVLGTPQYMSPEQTRGDKLDGRSDLFSCRHRAVPDDRRRAALPRRQPGGGGHQDRQRAGAADRPTRTDVPASLRRLIDRCLAKSPRSASRAVPNWPTRWSRCWPRSTRTHARSNKPRIVPLRVKWAR